MRFSVATLLLAVGFSLLQSAAQADAGAGQKPRAQAGHDPIGNPAQGLEITRTIDITIKETDSGYMLFEPDAIPIEEGSVVRFVIHNFGDLDHEFFLGSFDEVQEHQQWMREHPDMKHDDLNAVFIESGSSETLDWRFSNKTNLEFVCLVPGHREAGMFGVIMVHDHLARSPRN